MLYCGKCGAEVRDNAVFCAKCGSRLNDEQKLSENNIHIKRKQVMHPKSISIANNTNILIAIAAAITLIAGIITFLVLLNTNEVNKTADAPSLPVQDQQSNAADGDVHAQQNGQLGERSDNYTAGALPTEAENAVVTYEQDIYNTLTSEQKKDLNVFLSNFSEAFLKYYDADNVNTNDLINFAFIHDMINNNKLIRYKDSNMGISAERVSETLNKYFGKSITNESTNEWQYDGEYYWKSGAAGESYDYFSVALNLVDLNNGTYRVDFNTYYAGYDSMDPKCYWYSESDASNDTDCRRSDSGTAIIKSCVYNNKETWQLLKLTSKQT